MGKDTQLFYPGAKIDGIIMKTQGKYENNYPVGAVVHYTAGHYEKGKQSAIDTLKGAGTKENCFMIIDYDGGIWQVTPLDKWGSHAGASAWKGLGNRVSNKLVGIEMNNAGMLVEKDGKYYAWWDEKKVNPMPIDQVRVISKKNANQVKGAYHKYSPAQEKALIDLLVWLKKNNPEIFNVDYILGHDEVAGPEGIGFSRKQDPGGSLSMTMPELRKQIKERTK